MPCKPSRQNLFELKPTQIGTADYGNSTLWQALGNTTLASDPTCVNTTLSTPSLYPDYGLTSNCTVPNMDIPIVSAHLRRIPVTKTSRSAALAVPAGTGVRPAPDNESPCIGRSFTYPNWRIYNLTESFDESLSFTLENRALLSQIQCRTDGDRWTRCDEPAGKGSTFVRVQTMPFEVFVNQSWACAGIHADSRP